MGNEKFTKGEWRAVVNEPLEDDHICDVYDEHNNCICECFSHGYWGEERGITEAQKEANMHLIAAAPEMYYCICDALTDLEMSEGMRKYFETVLKKARGEE